MATTVARRLASVITPFVKRLLLLQRDTRRRPLIRQVIIMIPFLLLTCFLLVLLLPRPTTPIKTPLLALNFPDPCIIQDHPSGIWYAFASGWWTPTNTTTTTKPSYKNIQAASAPHPSGPWTYLPSADPLPSPGPWTAGPGPDSQTWAPSILQLPPNPNSPHKTTYILFYAAQTTTTPTSLHCIGAATSATSILGPYTPLPTPLICPLHLGGAIDPAVFRDPVDGRVYLLYKVDGNALGSGGECNNGVAPLRGTPIVLQEVVVGADGDGDGDGGEGVVRLVGEGVVVLDRDEDGGDGPLVEAPELVLVGDGGEGGEGVEGTYVLFYSNHCWDGPKYSVNYAVAEGNITGPYTRADGPLIRTGDAFNITAPGGAASVPGGGWMVFHGNCPEGRCLFGAEMAVVGSTVTVS